MTTQVLCDSGPSLNFQTIFSSFSTEKQKLMRMEMKAMKMSSGWKLFIDTESSNIKVVFGKELVLIIQPWHYRPKFEE